MQGGKPLIYQEWLISKIQKQLLQQQNYLEAMILRPESCKGTTETQNKSTSLGGNC